MAVNDVVSLRIVGRYQDQNIVNTTHWEIIEQAAEEELILAQMLATWEADIQASWLARHIDSYELVGIKGFNKAGAAKTPAFSSIGANGTVDGEEVPSCVCRTITLYTHSANHRRHGRLMLSGGATSMFDTDDGSVSTVEITALTALGGTFETGLSAAGNSFKLCIPATDVLPMETVFDSIGRETPSVVTSRRIRQFLIG